ncbi:hypothetical protein Tco_0912058 [Tanacetum coccineum]
MYKLRGRQLFRQHVSLAKAIISDEIPVSPGDRRYYVVYAASAHPVAVISIPQENGLRKTLLLGSVAWRDNLCRPSYNQVQAASALIAVLRA